ncbi:dihydroxyacetone phosphate acyltransferase [Zerene cesonia]|uniref:dihydroxyacetone phosphate acyltransferase n=1 Tax=Zerene cesonia TaxID=33412 RepID=UPI0018E59519|nr:dihydroxyacetone phosphate acyltransferase [Zerene cesonia]
MREKAEFTDILLPRNTHFGIIKFMTRHWKPKKTLNLDKDYSPQDIKNLVCKSTYLDSYLEAESANSGVPKEQLRKEVLKYLDEIAMDKKMHVIRCMGVFFLKVSFMMKIGIFVNEPAILKLKDSMGENPVLFLPTHRSYADFCVLTYLCYHYDIELPAVAAGMDFYSMAIVGQMMRETGAFYMRRTLVGAPLYAATLRHYVRTVVAHYGAPFEFFLEGTRSRSNKSLPPKYGMLAMSLMPYFAREVDDITIVPVNISYDRIMEQSLFAYEHLGVPKPKETTGGLLKALRRLNDHFGNIYINFGTPISLKQYIGPTAFSPETLKPRDLQQLTDQEMKLVQKVANHVVTLQQESTVVTITNLIAIVLMLSLHRRKVMDREEVVSEVEWLIEVLRSLGAIVFENDVRSSMERVMLVHGTMMRLDREGKLRLVSSALMDINPDVQKNMKGHKLKAETMTNAVPIMQLQLYINPVLHYLAPHALLYLIVRRRDIGTRELYADYSLIRKLLRHEFFHLEENESATFNKALEYCSSNRVVLQSGDTVSSGDNDRLQYLLQCAVLPALTSLLTCMEVMEERRRSGAAAAARGAQAAGERARRGGALSLDAAGAALRGLALAAALRRDAREKEVIYEVVLDVMQQCRQLVSSILPSLTLVTDNNPVIVQNTPKARL